MRSIKEIKKGKTKLNTQLKRHCKSYMRAIVNKDSDVKRMRVYHQGCMAQSKMEVFEWILSEEPNKYKVKL